MMSFLPKNLGRILYEAAFLFFVLSLFLILGSDVSPQWEARMVYAAGLLILFLLVFRRDVASTSAQSPALLFFLAFLGFEIFRALWAAWQGGVKGLSDGLFLPLLRYGSSPLIWSHYAGLLAMTLFFFRTRRRAHHLLWILCFGGFVLALNAIPPLLARGEYGFVQPGGDSAFFHPLFYSVGPVSKYLMGRFAHPNYTGDVMAVGAFSSLGLFIYFFGIFHEKRRFQEKHWQNAVSLLTILGTLTFSTILAVVAFLSRGTILCFFFALLFFLLANLVKFPSRAQFLALGSAVLLTAGVLIWAGNLPNVFEELGTLKDEKESTIVQGSFFVNQEGMRRALRIFREYPLWGVGTDGYQSLSLFFATPGTEFNPSSRTIEMAKFKAMSHYFQLLADEGGGAFLYFAFIVAYLVEVPRRLFQVTSRFQFLAGLSLFAPVLMFLSHASFNHLMQRFSISSLVYLLMGASLAVLSCEFHQT